MINHNCNTIFATSCFYLGVYNHPIEYALSLSTCMAYQCMANEVNKIPIAKKVANIIATSK